MALATETASAEANIMSDLLKKTFLRFAIWRAKYYCEAAVDA